MSTMRRKDREVKERDEILAIVNRGRICHLAMCADGEPYVIPMLYGYADDCLYFHCAEVGKKLDILRKNNRVCFEITNSPETIIENMGQPCDWGIPFESVIGFGNVELIETDGDAKKAAYDVLVTKLAPPGYTHTNGNYEEKKIKGTFIIKVRIESMTGKRWDGTKMPPAKPHA